MRFPAAGAHGSRLHGASGPIGFNRNGAVAVGRYGNVYAYRRGAVCYWQNNQRICPVNNRAITIGPRGCPDGDLLGDTGNR